MFSGRGGALGSMAHSLPHSRQSARAALRLICLPYAGGGTAPYHRWRWKLPARIEINPLSLPGHDGRLNEAPHTNLQTLVDSLADRLMRDAMIDGPFVLLGHSMGAWLAFEVARTLRRQNLRMPELLIVTAARPPATPAPANPWHRLPDDELVAKVDSRYGGIPAAVRNNPDALRLLLPALRADLQMVETYEFKEEPPLEVDILTMGGTEDPAVSVTQLNDWRRLTSGDFSVRLLPGGHFFLFQGTGAAAAATASTSQGDDEAPALQIIVNRLEELIARRSETTP
jgi:medium-chain acyl-[acyl-carrier-protein] hydrolase